MDLMRRSGQLLHVLTHNCCLAPCCCLQLSSLPLELLDVILQHVPLQERLKVCAVLSSRCKAAAVKATNTITLHAAPTTSVFHLLSFLKSYGSGITSIDLQPTIVTRPTALLELPSCAGLLSLTLTDALVQLTPGSQQLGVLHSCKALTSLKLLNCNVLDTSAQLAGLSVLKDLQDLRVVWDAGCTRRLEQPLSLLPGSLLSQLVKLTFIDLSSPMRFAHLQHLTCLNGLQTCRVTLADGAQQERFAKFKLLRGLTCLHLSCDQSSQQSMGYAEIRGLYQLTTLQDIMVSRCMSFKPWILRQMRGLRTLSLYKLHLVGGKAGTSDLLGVLPNLSALTRLDLQFTLQHHAAKLSDYTSLGALSELGVLDLTSCNLPVGLWPRLESAAGCVNVWSLCLDDAVDTTHGSQLSTAGLYSLAQCMPKLQVVSCVSALAHDADIHPLQQLSDLKQLSLSKVSDAHVPALTCLEQLVCLKIKAPSTITDCGALQLTALSRLTQLSIAGALSNSAPSAAQPAQPSATITIINRTWPTGVHMCGCVCGAEP